MATSLLAIHEITAKVQDANRNNLSIAEASRSFNKDSLTKTTGLVVDSVLHGVGDYTIPLGGITTVKSLYLFMTDDTIAAITIKLTTGASSDQVVSGRLISLQDCAIIAIKITKDSEKDYPIEYILSGD
jgi:hypothetical protein